MKLNTEKVQAIYLESDFAINEALKASNDLLNFDINVEISLEQFFKSIKEIKRDTFIFINLNFEGEQNGLTIAERAYRSGLKNIYIVSDQYRETSLILPNWEKGFGGYRIIWNTLGQETFENCLKELLIA